MKKIAQITATLLLSSLVLAGCGDDDKDSGSAGDPASETPSSETSEETSETPSEETSEETSEEPTEEESAETPESDFGDPATGATIKGDGYTYKIPGNWQDITAEAKQVQGTVDSAAGEANPSDGFRDNINVGFDQAQGASLDQLKASVPDQLKSLVKDLEVLDHVTIDGLEAIHHRGAAALGQTRYFLEQFAAIDDQDRIAIITFSFSRDVKPADRDKVINSVLASWKWA